MERDWSVNVDSSSNRMLRKSRSKIRKCLKCGRRLKRTGRSILVLVDDNVAIPIERHFNEYLCRRCVVWQCHDEHTDLQYIGHIEAAIQQLREVYEFEPNVHINEWNDS